LHKKRENHRTSEGFQRDSRGKGQRAQIRESRVELGDRRESREALQSREALESREQNADQSAESIKHGADSREHRAQDAVRESEVKKTGLRRSGRADREAEGTGKWGQRIERHMDAYLTWVANTALYGLSHGVVWP
jgi:hypothetical protein